MTRQEAIYEQVVGFFRDNDITCVESLYQMDGISESCADLLAVLFEIYASGGYDDG